MRVNPNQVSEVLAGLQQTQTQLNAALQEVSTGKSVNVPSDNPAASAIMVQNTIDTKDVDQYTQNASSVLSMVQTSDSALSSVVSSLTQAVTLGTEAANGTTNATDQQTIATQVQGILSSVVSLANTTYQGTYVFGGTANSQPPYTADPTSTSGYQYNGNTGVNSVAVGADLTVQSNVPGSQIFSNTNGDVLGSLGSLVSALQSGNTDDIESATAAITSALNNVSQQRVTYANAESQLNSQETYLQQETVSLTSQATSLVGVDMATAATALAQAQTANSAALAAASKVLPTTLLDYLVPPQ
jgi:flagellar hook-associated protein 3 FlgL